MLDKVKNQKTKDTFRRSIGKKFVEKEDYFLPNYNIKCFVRYMVSTFTSLVEECTLIMGM